MKICEKCAGCRACEMACPVNAITMVEDEEGFRQPKIDENVCVSCGLCKKICPQSNRIQIEMLKPQAAYAAQLSDENVLMTSTSGGVFAALAQDVFAVGGVVFGVKMDENQRAVHCMTDDISQLSSIRGSKYVASDTADTYRRAKEKLDSGVQVLYSGCPCQIAGLRAFLRKDYSNLLTVDVICHGAPSQKLFDVYRKGLEKKQGQVRDYLFRDKSRYGWGVYWSYVNASGKKKTGGIHDNPYCSAFIDNTANGECCYECRYVGLENRVGDITLGDYWSVDRVHPEMASNKGVSAVICNTEVGRKWAERALEKCRFVPSSAEIIGKYNPSLMEASIRPQVRDTIYKGIDSKSPEAFVKENLHIPMKKYIKTKIRLKIPYGARVRIKKLKALIKG